MNLVTIQDIIVHDLRFDTSTTLSGSDARSKSPDYSCIYLILKTNEDELNGCSLVFTLGKGNSVVEAAINELKPILNGLNLEFIIKNMKDLYNQLTNDQQMCWIGPDKGASHMAAGGLINSIWDLWAKYEEKPLWRLISDMDPIQLIDLLNFQYMDNVISEIDVGNILQENKDTRNDRIHDLEKNGLEAYTTSIGWSGYSNEEIETKCQLALNDGFKNFKMKVGFDLKKDMERAELIRKNIGWNKRLMMDANGVWDVTTARKKMIFLKKFNPYWIEEPTHPDDVIGHIKIKDEIFPVKVATGEQCPNKIMFKQFIQSEAISILQTDINRLAGLNEWLVVVLMAKKYGIPVCTHAGGIGLCQMAAHLAAIDYICIANSTEDRITEYVEHLQEHFKYPVSIKDGNYLLPTALGLGLELKNETISKYSFPNGSFWINQKDKWWNKQF